MDYSMKLYKNAVKLYGEGYIDKALDYSEKSISVNLKNTSAINLKGLLYYFKGELESAQALWKMNYQENRDLISMKYLEDSKNDKSKKLIYCSATTAIKEFKIKEAIELLQKCKESDFNNINVNNAMAICYIKQGEYSSAVKYIEEVLKIDKKNATATKNKKELKKVYGMKNENKFKYSNILIICIALLLVAGITSLTIKYIINPLSIKSKKAMEVVKTQPSNINQEVSNKKDTPENPVTNEKVFPSDELNKAIVEKDYEKLYVIANEWKDKKLGVNDKSSLVKGIELLQSRGIEYIYDKGRQALKASDYKASEKYFAMANDYGKEYYLYQDILYMLGYSYKNDNQIDNCLKLYEEYDSKFPKGTYEETVLYDLSLIYKSLDINKSKNYALKLSKQFPKSIYNNNIINSILKE